VCLDAFPPAPTIYLTSFSCKPGNGVYAESKGATGSNKPYRFQEQRKYSEGELYGFQDDDHVKADMMRSNKERENRKGDLGNLEGETEIEPLETVGRGIRNSTVPEFI
jgi:hypothetical protein